MIGGHGHVKPRPDGARARCGGPSICSECQKEKAAWDAEKKDFAEKTLAGDGELIRAADFKDWEMYETPNDEPPTVADYCALQANLKLRALRAKDLELREHQNEIIHKMQAEIDSQTKRLVDLADQYTALVRENTALKAEIERLRAQVKFDVEANEIQHKQLTALLEQLARLTREREEAPTMYGHCWNNETRLSDGNTFGWGHTQCSSDTHTARLIAIEEIKKPLPETIPE